MVVRRQTGYVCKRTEHIVPPVQNYSESWVSIDPTRLCLNFTPQPLPASPYQGRSGLCSPPDKGELEGVGV